MKTKYVFTKQIKEMAKICFNTLKIVKVKYGEIWFPWRNMVLCSILHTKVIVWFVIYNTATSAYVPDMIRLNQFALFQGQCVLLVHL